MEVEEKRIEKEKVCMEVEEKSIEKEKVWASQSTTTASREAAAVLDKMDDESCDYTTIK